MAYQNLALRNIAGEVAVTYNDNNMRSPRPEATSGPKMFLTGTAKSGAGQEPFNVLNTQELMNVFDSRSELADVFAAARQSNSEVPLMVSRVGAKPYHWILERQITGSNEKEPLIVITPMLTQEKDTERSILSTLESYKMLLMPFVEGNLTRQRVVLFGFNAAETDHIVLFDSERLIQVNGDAIFDVEINIAIGECLVTLDGFTAAQQAAFPATFTDQNLKDLSEISSFEHTGLVNLDTIAVAQIKKIDLVAKTHSALSTSESIDKIVGSNGINISHCERYASNELAYEKLEFEDFQYLYCEKCYADTPAVNLNDGMQLADQLLWHNRSLGYMWRYNFNGRPYVYMFGRKNPFEDGNVDDYTANNITYTLSADNKKLGDLLNLVEFNFLADNSIAAGDTAVESFVNRKGIIECHIRCTNAVDRSSSNQIKTPFCEISFGNTVLPNNTDTLKHRFRPSEVGTTAARTLSDNLIATDPALDPFVLTHFDLTGELIPESVSNRLLTFEEDFNQTTGVSGTLKAAPVEVREVSFLHQVAQAAYTASTNYNQIIALVPTSPPAAGRHAINLWAGNPAQYQINAVGELVVTKDGTGILGTKLLAGAKGYRNDAAFGGVILTNGDELPNKIPYGIDDSDEALDASGNPIDIGKHCVVVGAYGLVSSAQSIFPSIGKRFRVSNTPGKFMNAAPKIAAILNQLPAGMEPIGVENGVVEGFSPQQLTPRKVLNDLAALRISMIDQTGVISSIYTAALRTSDYSKISSIISANQIVRTIRAVCNPVIGRAYSDAQIASLQQTIEGVSRSLVNDNYAQSLNVSFYGSALDRINGVLRCSVVFVPPLSIEAVTIDLTLEAPIV